MLPANIWSSMLLFVTEVLRLSSRPAHQPGSFVRLRNGVLCLSDIGSLLHPVEALVQAGEESAGRLRQQLLNTLVLVEVRQPTLCKFILQLARDGNTYMQGASNKARSKSPFVLHNDKIQSMACFWQLPNSL